MNKLKETWAKYLDEALKAHPLPAKQCGNCVHFERGNCKKHTIEVSYCFAGCHNWRAK